jgi:hypothetical protein
MSQPPVGQSKGALGESSRRRIRFPTAANNNWSMKIGLFAAAYFLGAGCWAFINSEERLHE